MLPANWGSQMLRQVGLRFFSSTGPDSKSYTPCGNHRTCPHQNPSTAEISFIELPVKINIGFLTTLVCMLPRNLKPTPGPVLHRQVCTFRTQDRLQVSVCFWHCTWPFVTQLLIFLRPCFSRSLEKELDDRLTWPLPALAISFTSPRKW